jgi:hypothetical protein
MPEAHPEHLLLARGQPSLLGIGVAVGMLVDRYLRSNGSLDS